MNDRMLEDPDELEAQITEVFENSLKENQSLSEETLNIDFVDPVVKLPESGKDCLLKIEFDDEPSELYWLCSGYYEHGRWMLFNGCSRPLDLGDTVVGWRYIEV